MRRLINLSILIVSLLFTRPSYPSELEPLKLRIQADKAVYDMAEPKIITLILSNNTNTSILLKSQAKYQDAKRLTLWVRRQDKPIKSQDIHWEFKKNILKARESLIHTFDLSSLGLMPGTYRIDLWFNHQGLIIKSNFMDIKIKNTYSPDGDYIGVTREMLEAASQKFNGKAIFLQGRHFYSNTDRVLDDIIWLHVLDTSELMNEPIDYRQPKNQPQGYNCFVYGIFHCDNLKRFGNFGQYKYSIDVDRIVFSDKLEKVSP